MRGKTMSQRVRMGSLSYPGNLHGTSHHATHGARGKVPTGSLAEKKILVRIVGGVSVQMFRKLHGDSKKSLMT